MENNSTPTAATYASILQAYDFFNQALFENKLPKVIVTYHRQRRVMGYASIARWVSSERECVDELAVNPEYFAKYPLVEICQTLCHEMTFCRNLNAFKRRPSSPAIAFQNTKTVGITPKLGFTAKKLDSRPLFQNLIQIVHETIF